MGKWAEKCRTAGTTSFIWAHNGTSKNGVVTLRENGILETPWQEGSWKVVDGEEEIIDMTFGSCRHMCHFTTGGDGGFVVERRTMLRTGKDGYKPGMAKTR